MKKRLFASLLCLALCLGLLPATALADASVVVNPSEGGNAVVIIPSDDGTVTVVIEELEPEPEPPAIGDTVGFAGHEWYIIGTETEGVTAPSGCYTLFAKNNDFGFTTFRAESSNDDNTANYYKDSDLQKKMEEIADSFSPVDQGDIVPRSSLDEIQGGAVTNQMLWPIGSNEVEKVDMTLRCFPARYWTRTGFLRTDPELDTGIDFYNYYIYGVETDGVRIGNTLAVSNDSWLSPSCDNAIRPALYVKAEAVDQAGETTQAAPLIGGQVVFGGQTWYIVGMGDTGPVTGPANTVTLFLSSNLYDLNGKLQKVRTRTNYSESPLCEAMTNAGNTLGLSEKEKSLVSSRTLTTADGITGNTVTTPFWPLSQSEFEAIQAENPSLLTEQEFEYWLRTPASGQKVYIGTTQGTLSSLESGDNGWLNAVRPAFYLDLSKLFFAAGEGSITNEGLPLTKIAPPTDPSYNIWIFILHDETLSLSMTAAKDQRGDSLTFQYEGTMGEHNHLSYVLEKVNVPGVPAYYGCVALLNDSGSGTVTVPLLDSNSELKNGDYTMRFYTEDRSSGVYFASDTVDLTIHVENGQVSITDLGDVAEASGISGVTITPANPTLEAGQQQQFTATVTPSGSAWCDSAVNWAVTGAQSSKTTIFSTGLLSVALDETASSLTVTATSKQDSSKSSSATVTVKAHTHTGTLVPGQEATCTAEGVKDYYQCSVCHQCFEDADCTTLITDLETWKVIPALPHQGGLVSGTPAACTTAGTKDYYECSACHQYFEDADCTTPITDLDAWKVIPALGHNWSGTYLAEHADAERHYHVCTVCGEKGEGQTHTWNYDAATEEHDKHCTVCGYVAEPIVEHEHQSTLVSGTPATCTTAGTKDYYECSVCHQCFEDADCTTLITDLDAWKVIPALPHQGGLVPGTPAACTAEGVKDYYECSACHQYFEDEACTTPITDLETWKVIPALGHNWSDTYLAENADTEKHYHVCTVCGEKGEGQTHTWNYDAATEEHDKHCTVCGYVAEPIVEHDHQSVLVPGTPATCTAEGVKDYYQCSVCHQCFEDADCTTLIEDLDAWKVIPALPHQGVLVPGMPATCTAEGVKDYYQCSVCRQCFEDADCTTLIENLETWKVIPALPHQGVLVPGTPVTCTAEGVKDYYQCSTCHQCFEDADCTTPITDLETWKVIPALGHNWSAPYSAEHADAERHYHVCTVCGARDDGEAHTWNMDAATEQDGKHCTICGYVAEAPVGHTHTGTLVPGQEATCTQAGIKAYYTCTCGQNFEDEACTTPITDLGSWREIPAPGHDWSGTYLAEHADAEKHYHVCTVCGAKDTGEAHTWNYDAATEAHDKHCTTCGYVAEEQLAHTHTYSTEWEYNGDTHWHECSCGAKANQAIHEYDNDQDSTCNICGYVRQTVPLEYTVTFNANGGSVNPSSAVTTGGKLASLPTPTRAGYDFVGWYTAASGGQQVTTNTDFTQTTTVYAHWSIHESSGGDSGGGGGSSGGNPSQPTAPATENSKGWTDIQKELNRAQEGEAVVVDMNGATEIPGEVFEDVAGKNVTVTFDMGDGVTWTVNGLNIPDGTTLSDLNLGVTMDASTIPVSVVNTITGAVDTIQISLKHDGEFGFTMTLSAPLGKTNAGYWANLYYYNTRTRALEFQTADRIASDGTAGFPFSHASDYAIVIDDESHEPVELPFTDVPEDAWYADAAGYVYKHGLMAGTSATTFAPDVTTSRAMIATILWRMAGSPQVNYAMNYTDVDSSAWYAEAVRWATSQGVVTGYGNGLFGSNDPITREQLATMLWRYAQTEDYDVSVGEDTNILSYADVGDLAEYAIPAMQWAVGAGIITGTGNGSTLTPQGNATRAQAAVMLQRFCEEYMTW